MSAEGKQIPLPEQKGDIEEYINILVEHQTNCERLGRYVDADLAKQRVNDLRAQLEAERRLELKNRHHAERMGVEKEHLNEFNLFNEFWDKRMQEFDNEATNIEKELVERQNEEFQRVQQELDRAIPYKQKDSSEVLNLKKIEDHLAKQKNYQEAHQVQQRRIALEKEENKVWLNVRAQKIQNQLNQLKARQTNELNALRQRISAGQDEQRKNRSIELERLLQKYQNVKKELEDQHEKEVLAFEKLFKSKAQTSVNSRFNSMKMGTSFQKSQ